MRKVSLRLGNNMRKVSLRLGNTMIKVSSRLGNYMRNVSLRLRVGNRMMQLGKFSPLAVKRASLTRLVVKTT